MRLPTRHPTGEVIGLLDIGSHKVVCMIVSVARDEEGLRHAETVLGIGHQRSKGVKSGVIVNLDEAEASVRAAVSQAERHAGCRIERVIATVTCGRLASQRFKAHVDLGSGAVTHADIARLHAGAQAYAERGGRMLIHWNRLGFSVDGASHVANPIGARGTRLSGAYHAVAGDEGPIRNLILLIERCYLTVEALIPGPVAAALATTTPQERVHGITAVDMGGGTTSYATFRGRDLYDCGVIPLGGQHVTVDIARRLMTPWPEAERIKTLYATMAIAPSDAHGVLTYPSSDPITGDEEGKVTRAELHDVVAVRVMRQLDALAERLVDSDETDPRMVLTGGASQLPALVMAAANRLGRAVRLGRPTAWPGMPAQNATPQMAAVLGLAACVPFANGETGDPGIKAGGRGLIDKVQSWVMEVSRKF